MAAVIEVSGLVKTFGRERALDGLDLHVEAGEVHGFLGPNGAGKSTTLRVLLGLLRADEGSARLLGGDPWRDAVALHRRLAYVPGDVTLWPTLTGGEVIDLLGRLHGDTDEAMRADLIQRFELDPTKRSRAYSRGNRQKVALVAAFASRAELLVLDEPTSGLDPLMEAVFRECIGEARARGVSVLLSSHVLAEVEALADRLTIIRSGRTVDTGSLADLRHLARTSVRAELDRAVPGLEGMPGVHELQVEPLDLSARGEGQGSPGAADGSARVGEGVRVSCQVDTAQLGVVLSALAAAGVRTLDSRPPTLEELFLRHYAADPGEPATVATGDGAR